MNWLTLLYRIFPATCVSCRAMTYRHLDLCAGCQRDLPKFQQPCWMCGLPYVSQYEICYPCQEAPKPYSHTFSGFRYDWPVDQLIHQFKFNNNVPVGLVLSTILARRYLRQHILKPDVWIPVPLHPKRQRKRGFNQAEQIAQALADATGVPVDKSLVSRVVETQSQADLSASDRVANVHNAFRATERVDNLSVAIVDDVITTGSTVTELTNLLLAQGARDVQLVCLARTPEK